MDRHRLVRFHCFCPLYTMEETRSLPSRPSWWDRWTSETLRSSGISYVTSRFVILFCMDFYREIQISRGRFEISRLLHHARCKKNNNNKKFSRSLRRIWQSAPAKSGPHPETSRPSHRERGIKAVTTSKTVSMPCTLLPFRGCAYLSFCLASTYALLQIGCSRRVHISH